MSIRSEQEQKEIQRKLVLLICNLVSCWKNCNQFVKLSFGSCFYENKDIHIVKSVSITELAKEIPIHLGAIGYHRSSVWTDGSPWTKFEMFAKGITLYCMHKKLCLPKICIGRGPGDSFDHFLRWATFLGVTEFCSCLKHAKVSRSQSLQSVWV